MVWDHFYSAKVPFCCFRNNFYTSSKRYHTTKAQATAFFDSTFNYLRQQGQLTVHDSTLHSGRLHVNPLPSVSAHGLQIDDERNLPDTSAGIVIAGTGNTVLNVINLSPALLKSNYLPKISIGEADVTSKKPIISKKTQQIRQFSTNYELKESKVSIKDAVRDAAKKIKLDEAKKEEIAAKVEKPAKEEQLKEQPVQDDSTFLQEQSTQILLAHEAKDYNKINSIYLALKRNNIVPSREIYKIVLNSISVRTLDDSVDEKLSVMLTVYQDLITNKIKPDLSIYSIVLEKLLVSSILSFKDSNVSNNGFDFFKIAIDIFNASNVSNIQQFDYKILNSILIGMNLYPGIVNIESLMRLFQKNGQDGVSSFEKNQFYYIGLINYCKKLNDPTISIKLYEEFKELSQNKENSNLVNYQFEVYSVFISTLIETNQISIATKFLDKLLISIKNFENYEPKISKLLSSYILSLSKINAEKSFEIWENFNKIQWIPDFSYNFYSNFLPNLNEISYEKQLKVYNFMSALEIKQEPTNLENILIVPKINKPSISLFLVNAIEHNDKQTVLKIVKESFLRSNQFQPEVYPLLFDYLNNLNLSLSIVNNHGINSADKFKFLNELIISVNSNNNNSEISLSVLNQIYKTNFFKELINCFNLNENNSNLYNNSLFGMITIFNNSIFTQYSNTNTSLNNSSNSNNLQIVELLAPLIIEFNDTLNYYTPLSNELIQFKSDLNAFFKFETQTMDLSNCSSQVHEALELLKN